ncbi:MAG: S8 family serine peptidase [Corynebacteriales bacterium]|nr:S8 family serine peptidase [Mycobacteriales bacterium]
MKRPWLIGAVALSVVLVLIAAVSVLRLSDDSKHTAKPTRPDLPFREDLLKQAKPDPGCTNNPRSQPSGSGEVTLGLIRLRGHCLISETVLASKADATAKLDELREQEDVVAADRVEPERPPLEPTDPHPATEGVPEPQWGVDALGGQEALRALRSADAPEITIGVVDSGLDTQQAEFGDRVIAVKDTELGSDRYESHGTEVAGIIAAADDGTGITGMVPNAKLLDAQYWRNGESVGEPGIHDEIIWTIDQGSQVVNLSAGSNDSSLLRAAFQYAELNRVVLVPAVGNCGGTGRRITYPWEQEYIRTACDAPNEIAGQADQPTAIGTGALTDEGKRAWFSSVNRTVMIMAPGQKVLSTCVARVSGPRSLCTNDGTSFAAPFVTGAVAILLARHPEARPADIRQALTMTTDPIDVERGHRNDEFGYGKLNVVAAAKYLDDHPPSQVEQQDIAAAQVTDTESATHRTELILDSGEKLEVQQLKQNGEAPALAFSGDGDWFAASDGETLTVVDARTGRQQSTTCGCRGVAFNTKNKVLTAQSGNGKVQVAQYDPKTADWTGTTYAPELSPSESGSATVVGAAGDVALLTVGPSQVQEERLIGVWPDSKNIPLLDTEEGIGKVTASSDGRYVVAAGVAYCYHDAREYRLIDLDQTRKKNKAWAKPLSPSAALSCAAATSLHFEGSDLYAGWVAALDGVRDFCKGQNLDASVVVSGHVKIGPFKPTDEYTRTDWKDLNCGPAGSWHLSNGEQLQLRAGPLSPSLDRMPQNYQLVRLRPGGEPEVILADNAEIIAVRPR